MGTEERRQKEKTIRKNDIIEAAERVFFSKGYREATIDEVAKEAEYSKKTIYSYFLGKEHIYFEIMIKGYRLMIERVENDLENAAKAPGFDAIEELRVMFYSFYAFSVEQSDYFQAIIGYETEKGEMESKLPPEAKKECYDLGEKLLDTLTAILQRGIESGAVHDVSDARLTALIFWACTVGIFVTVKNKERYLSEYHGTDKEQFLAGAFRQVIRSVTA